MPSEEDYRELKPSLMLGRAGVYKLCLAVDKRRTEVEGQNKRPHREVMEQHVPSICGVVGPWAIGGFFLAIQKRSANISQTTAPVLISSRLLFSPSREQIVATSSSKIAKRPCCCAASITEIPVLEHIHILLTLTLNLMQNGKHMQITSYSA